MGTCILPNCCDSKTVIMRDLFVGKYVIFMRVIVSFATI